MRNARLNDPVDDLFDALCGMRIQSDRNTRGGTALRPRLNPLVGKDPVGHCDLILPGCGRRVTDAAVSGPGGWLELQPTVFAVSGVGLPVAAGLALRHRIPVGG